MKYCLCLLIACISHCCLLLAQNRSIRVKAGEDLAQAYSPQGFYRFPKFGKAVLYFTGGNKNSGPLFNYNVLSGAMQFINPAGDTLDMGNNMALDSMVFDQTAFVYKDGFLETVASVDSVQLLKKLILKTQIENVGAYGMSNNTASITSMKSYFSGTSVYNLVVNQDVVVTESTTWFFKNGSNIVKASKSNLLKLLAADKAAKAESYLKENKTSFDKESDLKKLMAALAG